MPCSKLRPNPTHWMYRPISRILCGAHHTAASKNATLMDSAAYRRYHRNMQFLEAIATAFFRTFGITQPSEQRLRRAAWFLFGLLTLIVVSIGTVCIILFRSM
jgi:ATP/ADP translocase